jgi:hypothetical protein
LHIIRIPDDVSSVVGPSALGRDALVNNARIVKVDAGRRIMVDVPTAEDLTEFFMKS